MHFIKRTKAAYLYGRGCGKFYKKKYQEALPIFEKVQKLQSEIGVENNESVLYFIGWCHRMLGNREDAVRVMAIAYELFRSKIELNNYVGENFNKEFIALADEYARLLAEYEQNELSKKISDSKDKLVSLVNKRKGVRARNRGAH